MALPRAFHDASSYVLGLALVALGTGFVARGRAYAGLGGMVVATSNRGEIALWVLLAGVLWIAFGRRADARPLRRAGWWYALSGAVLVSLSRLGWRASERFWLAFRQHFSWGHPEHATVEEVFPGAASITDALRVDPGAFGAHVARSVVDLPGGLARLVLDAWDWIPWLQAALIAALLWLAVLGGARRVLARPRPAPARGPGVVLFLISASTVIAVSLVLLPRPPLLAPLVPMALFFLFGAAASGWQALSARVAPIRSYGRLLPAVVTLAVLGAGGPFRGSAVVVAGGPLPGSAQARTPHRAAVELLRERLQPGAVLLAAQADALLLYADLEGARGISPTSLAFQIEHGRLDLRNVAERFRPGFLLDTPLLRADPARNQQLESMLQGGDWHLVERRPGAGLYARAP